MTQADRRCHATGTLRGIHGRKSQGRSEAGGKKREEKKEIAGRGGKAKCEDNTEEIKER